MSTDSTTTTPKQSSVALTTGIALVTVIFFWASAFVGIRAGLTGYSPGALALLRYGVASVCMIPLFLTTKRHTFNLKDFGQFVLIGVLGFSIYNVALNYGEMTVTAGIASFIISLIPILITLFAVVFLKEKFTKLAWIGVLVSFIGIVIIAIGESDQATFDYGVLYTLIATIASALYVIIQKPLLKRFSAIEVTSYAIWTGTFCMLIYLPQLWQQLPHANITATVAAIYMGIFPAAIAYLLWSFVLTHMPASRAASFLYFLPVVTIILGWLLLGETPSLIAIAGGFIALLGTAIVNKWRKR